MFVVNAHKFGIEHIESCNVDAPLVGYTELIVGGKLDEGDEIGLGYGVVVVGCLEEVVVACLEVEGAGLAWVEEVLGEEVGCGGCWCC